MTMLSHLLNRLSGLMAFVALMLLPAMMMVTVLDVLLRFSLDIPILGVVDLTRLFMGGIVFSVLPLSFVRGVHVSVEQFTDRLPPPFLNFLLAFHLFVASILLGLLAYHTGTRGWEEHSYGDVSDTLAIPILWYWLPLILGMALSSLEATLLGFKHLLLSFGVPRSEEVPQ